MYLLYSIIFTVTFLLMLPLFFLRREKYASGFWQRFGIYPKFKSDGKPVIWLHCVSVGETNAARPLADALLNNFPGHRLIISTTTRTGQELARQIFADKAAAIFYFPFDWKFSVRRSLKHFGPAMVLLMETEIWPRFIHEAQKTGTSVVLVNGRLSEKSFARYSKIRPFIRRVFGNLSAALMQAAPDAERIISLGFAPEKTFITGNLKIDHSLTSAEDIMTESFRKRFLGSEASRPLIVAASTHEPEELLLLEAFRQIPEMMAKCSSPRLEYALPRMVIVPRHPERFERVWQIISRSGFASVRRSGVPGDDDETSDLILLDSIGELRSIFPLADIVFVGGSLIPHGGQSVLEPAAAGKAIVIGPFFSNFATIITDMKKSSAIAVIRSVSREKMANELAREFAGLLAKPDKRSLLGTNARRMIDKNKGAAERTILELKKIITRREF